MKKEFSVGLLLFLLWSGACVAADKSDCEKGLLARDPYQVLLSEAQVEDLSSEPKKFALAIERSEGKAIQFLRGLDTASLRVVVQLMIDRYNRSIGYLPGLNPQIPIREARELEAAQDLLAAVIANVVGPLVLSKQLLALGVTDVIAASEVAEIIAQAGALGELTRRLGIQNLK